MSDSDRRHRRRVGDATQQHIDDLADGWKLPGSTAKPPLPARPVFDDEARSSVGRNAVAGELNVDNDVDLLAKTPIPGAQRPSLRRQSASSPPPRAPNPILPARLSSPENVAAARPVIEAQKSRDDDATELMTGLPAGLRAQRGDATVLLTERAAPSTVGLASVSNLPRKRGLFGDARYVFTVLSGVTAARGELTDVRKKLDRERSRRDHHILRIAREVAADPAITLPFVGDSRHKLAAIEEERARDAGIVAASETEIESIVRQGNAEAEADAAEVTRLETSLAQIGESLEPLAQKVSKVRKKADELASTLRALDEQLKRLHDRIDAGRGDPVSLRAQLASVRTERNAVAREQPHTTDKLEKLVPKLNQLKTKRDTTQAQLKAHREHDREQKRKTETALKELREQKAAKEKTVVEADRSRTDVLRSLGETLCIERPKQPALDLRDIDHHDVVIATLERQAMDLEDRVHGVDKAKLTRGLLLLLTACAIPIIVVLTLL
ncbi:MAG: hypothetical protein MJE77_43895 [Proteobacteria bacterium]|nr:hypothetical protein [Pseudomonadota bacterium]